MAKQMSLAMAQVVVAKIEYSTVKAILRSHGVELWLDKESIVRQLLAEKIESGEIKDPTITIDTVMTIV